MSKRHYCIEFTLDGPVHIGNGNQYGKKDYFQSNGKIAVLDVKKFVANLNDEQLRNYCEFLEGSSREADLQTFLKRHQLMKMAEKSIAYYVESKLAKARRGDIQYHDVWEFVKDAYGNPYIPGSSVKGMLRTALLNYLVLENKSYANCYDESLACSRNKRDSGKAGKKLEKNAFFLEQPIKNDPSVKNDIMKYISVSDSEPLSCRDLVFVKKYDKFCQKDDGRHKRDMGKSTDYEGNPLDVYRECLRPGTVVSVTIDIDSRIDEYLPFTLDAKGLEQTLTRSYELYKKCFLDYFDTEEESTGSGNKNGDGQCHYVMAAGPLAGHRCRNQAVNGTLFCNTHQDQAAASSSAPSSNSITCYLGGGVDFNSKTVINALFNDNDSKRVKAMAQVLYSQFPTKLDTNRHRGLAEEVEKAGYRPEPFRARFKKNGRLSKAKEDHRHWRDVEFGVAPHTMKLGLLNGEKLPMGKCSITIKEQK